MKIFWSIICCLFLLSCSKSKIPPKDTMVLALGATPSALDPRYATDANGMRINSLIFHSLVKIGPDLNIVGDAAHKWEIKDSTFTFYLKTDIMFSNGRSLTSEDILFSIEEYKKDSCPFQAAFKDVDEVKVEETKEGLKLSLKLKQYSAKFLTSDLPTFKILPKQEVLSNQNDYSRFPLGSGPYRITKNDSNQIELEKNKYYTQEPSEHSKQSSRIQKLVFKIIRDDFTRYQKMVNGEVDIAQSEIPLEKVKLFEEKSDQFTVFKYPGLSFTYILLNLNDPKIKKLGARQAIAHAINRKEIIDFKLEGHGLLATSILTPTNPFFNKQLNPVPYALDKAKELINKLSLSESKLILKTSNSASAVDIGKVIVNQLQMAGIPADLQSYEWGTFYGDVSKGNFQLATMRWVGAIDPDIYRVALHSQEIENGRNRGGYTNRKLDNLLEGGLSIRDHEKRIQHYKEVQKIVMDELPIIPLWYNQQVTIINNRVKNFKPSQNGDYTPILSAYK